MHYESFGSSVELVRSIDTKHGRRYISRRREVVDNARGLRNVLAEQENPVMLEKCRLIELPVIRDPRGNLTFVEESRHIPFPIRRVYYLYDVPGGASRGGHAHKVLHQFVIAISGSFDVLLTDGVATKKIHLNRSFHGLYICPMIWREIDNFSSGSVCLVLASEFFDEADYYRDLRDFKDQLSVP